MDAHLPGAPAVSVIIPHYQDLDRLDLCLTALTQQRGVPDFEIVVADNMSPVGEEAVRRLIADRAKLTIATERGAGPARNAGVAAAAGATLAFTDCDCLPDPGWLDAGIAALAQHDLVGGRMYVSVPKGRAMNGAEAFERLFAFDNRDYVRKKGFTVTANLFCSRTLFDAVGPFRTGVSEDMEWCHRARANGYRLGYAEDAVVGHPPRADWGETIRKWRRINAETYGLYKERRWGRVRWAAHSWILLPSILAHAPRIMTSPLLSRPSERLGALAMLVRLRLWRWVDAHRLMLSDPGGRV